MLNAVCFAHKHNRYMYLYIWTMALQKQPVYMYIFGCITKFPVKILNNQSKLMPQGWDLDQSKKQRSDFNFVLSG